MDVRMEHIASLAELRRMKRWYQAFYDSWDKVPAEVVACMREEEREAFATIFANDGIEYIFEPAPENQPRFWKVLTEQKPKLYVGVQENSWADLLGSPPYRCDLITEIAGRCIKLDLLAIDYGFRGALQRGSDLSKEWDPIFWMPRPLAKTYFWILKRMVFIYENEMAVTYKWQLPGNFHLTYDTLVRSTLWHEKGKRGGFDKVPLPPECRRQLLEWFPHFAELRKTINVDDDEECPECYLFRAFIDTRPFGVWAPLGDQLFVAEGDQSLQLYHFHQSNYRELRYITDPVEAVDRYVEHVLLNPYEPFDFMPWSRPVGSGLSEV